MFVTVMLIYRHGAIMAYSEKLYFVLKSSSNFCLKSHSACQKDAYSTDVIRKEKAICKQNIPLQELSDQRLFVSFPQQIILSIDNLGQLIYKP